MIKFILGFIIGIITILILKKDDENYYEQRAKELEDEIAMMGWLDVKDE